MTDIGIDIKVSSDGSVSVKRDLDSVAQSADFAMAATEKMTGTLNAVKAPTLKSVAGDFNSIGASAIANANRITTASVAFGKFGRDAQAAATETISAFAPIGSIIDNIKTKMAGFGTSVSSGVQSAIGKVSAFKTALMGVRPAVSGVGGAAGGASLNVANLAAQFNDIGVTAAMMQSPLQIALQQGTQISQVFGNQGAAGALKMLGQAIVQTLSPLSLFTIGAVAGIAALIQMVNWTKVLIAALDGIAKGIAWFQSNLETLRPYIIGVGAALIAAFGPSMLAMVGSLTVAIGKGLFSAIASVFTLVMKNPIVAAFTAVVTVVSVVIEKTIGWQAALQGVIELFGKIVEAAGNLPKFLGGGDWLTQKGIEIQVNAKQAARDLLGSLQSGTSKLLDAARLGALSARDSLQAGLDAGATAGADKLKKAIDDGSTSGADKLAKAANASITGAGDSAGQSMGRSIEDAGAKVTLNLSSAMSDVLAGFQAFGGDLLAAMDNAAAVARLQVQQLMANVRETNARASLAQQQARSESINRGKSNSNSSSGMSMGTRVGSSTFTPFTNSTPTPRDTTQTTNTTNNTTTTTTSTTTTGEKLTINNLIDPKAMLDSLGTQAGNKAVVNVIKANKSELQQILGIG